MVVIDFFPQLGDESCSSAFFDEISFTVSFCKAARDADVYAMVIYRTTRNEMPAYIPPKDDNR